MNILKSRITLGVLFALIASGCGDRPEVIGTVTADGSSTVFPVTEAVAEEFQIEMGPGINITLGQSGTGGGFRRFCTGLTDISNASRPISATEIEECAAAGVEYLQLTVGLDGLAILVHPDNDFVQCLTVDELRRIWEPSSAIQSWAEVRDGFPDRPLRLYGPGTNSGTFDYFTEVITHQVGASRADYTASEDDNVLVQGVAGDVNSLGYFGYAYYVENQGRVKVVAVDSGDGCITPERTSIETGSYAPLSRPLWIYVNTASLEQPAVRQFIDFYMEIVPMLAPEVGYVPLSDEAYEAERAKLTQTPDA